MDSIFIKFDKFYDITIFINDVRKISGNVMAKQGSALVSAKSLMGIFSLDLGEKIQILFDKTLNSNDKELLNKYKV